MALTEKNKLFAEMYLANGFNAQEAYYETFGKVDNKKPSYPYTLLKKKEVADYIAKRRQEIYDSLNIDAIRVMEEIAKIAFAPSESNALGAKVKALELLSKNLSLQTLKTENKDIIEVQLVEDQAND